MDLNDIIAGVAKNPALAETIGNLGIDPAMCRPRAGSTGHFPSR